jgi:hypothetical protein
VTDPRVAIKSKTSWRPHVVRARTLLALGLLLTSVLVAILTLNAFSARSQLSQLAFIYAADVSKFGLSFSTFAPISIAPTLISIIVGLWWDQLDMTWRILQPFISMSQGPTPIHGGAGLTYRSKSWIGAAIKSGRQRHWVLFMISIGSVVAQVLTVSMSALFERQSHAITQPVKLQQSLEIRQVPLINEVDFDKGTGETPAMLVLDKLYLDTAKIGSMEPVHNSHQMVPNFLGHQVAGVFYLSTFPRFLAIHKRRTSPTAAFTTRTCG